MSDQSRPPFVGLRPFEKADHHWFRGRDQEIATLLQKVRNHRFTAVVGASGSGKSSLVRAGILPFLANEKWQSIIVKPGSAPIAKLAMAFSESAHEDDTATLAEARTYYYDTLLRQSAYGLNEIADQLAPDAPKILLVVDQFEELFRYGEEAQGLKKAAMEEEGHAFVELLLTAAAHSAGRLHVVITMRSDFFGNCAIYPGLAEAVSASQYLVPLPGRDQLEAIIRAPINDAGAQIDNMLVQRLLLDVAHETDLLPTLQHTLRRLWEIAPGEPKHLRDEDYQTIGGIKGSIHVKAEQLTDSLKKSEFHKDDLITLEKLMKAITLLDEQDRAIRRPQQYSALLDLITEVLGLGDRKRAKASLDRALDMLASEDASFIQKGIGDDPEIDISHEALIRSWQRLCGEKRNFKSGWLFEERDDGREWWNLVRRTESKRRLALRDSWNIFIRIRKNKIGPQWCQRYGNAWQSVQEFRRKSFIISGALALTGVMAFLAIGGVAFTFYQENKLQQEETLRQARAGALAAAALSRSHTNDGNARLGALIALSVTPESRRDDDPRYVNEVGIALVNALTRSIEIMRRYHKSPVLSVAFSPDGSRIVSGSLDGALRVWDVKTGQPIGKPLQGHESIVLCVAFSPDGSRIVSGSWDETLRLWDAKIGQPIGEPLQGHESIVLSVAFSPDGSRIVSGSLDETLRLWDAKTGQPIGKPLQGHESRVSSVAFSPDGSIIMSGSWDKTLRLWDAKTGEPIGKPLQGHEGEVSSVAFPPDGSIIVSGSWDKTLRLWDAKTGQPIGKPLQGHESRVSSVAFSPDGSRIVSGSLDETLRLWDAKTGQPSGGSLQGHKGEVSSVAFSPDGSIIVSGSGDRTLRLWNVQTDQSVGKPLQGHQGEVSSVAFSPDGSIIVSGSEDRTLRLWDAKTGQPIGKPLQRHESRVSSVAFSPNGNRIVSGSKDRTLRLWDAKTGQPIGEPLQGHTDSVKSVAFSPDGSRIVSGSWNETLRLWDAKTGQPIGGSLQGHGSAVFSVAFSPDGSLIVSGGLDEALRLWDAKTGQPISGPLQGHRNNVLSVAFSPDSSRIISGSKDSTLRLWDAKTGQPVGEPFQGHDGAVSSVAFSPDGNRIVSGSWDKALRLWDAKTGQPIGEPLQGHGDGVLSVASSPDGNLIVSGSSDGTLRLWDARMFMVSLKELAERADKLCPLSEAERQQLGLYDPLTKVTAKSLTPYQSWACGESVYP